MEKDVDAQARGPVRRRLRARAADGRTMRFVDLSLYLGAVYGLSWVVACSKLLRPVRSRLVSVPLVGQLVHCIVCVSAWTGLGLALLLPQMTLLPESFRCRSAADVVLLVAAALASTWLVARAVGDAD